MSWLIGLVAFGAVSAITPGPNNVLLWAAGAAFGVRRAMPHVLGTAVGLGLMALLAAAGLAAVLAAVPALAVAMKLAGSAYLLRLAWRIGRAGGLQRAETARPLSLAEATAFQAANPKAWIFALGAVTTFRPADVDPLAGTLLVAGIMVAVVVPCALAWAAAGGAMAGLLDGERTRRVVRVGLAALVALSVVLVWA